MGVCYLPDSEGKLLQGYLEGEHEFCVQLFVHPSQPESQISLRTPPKRGKNLGDTRRLLIAAGSFSLAWKNRHMANSLFLTKLSA